MSTTCNKPRKAGRPREESFTDSELAHLLELPVALVRARCRLSFFCGAEKQDDESWIIPARAVRQSLRSTLEPCYSVESAARLLDVSYWTLTRIVHGVTTLSDPLPNGKRLRALLVPLGEGAPVKRVPESELRRFLGGSRRP